MPCQSTEKGQSLLDTTLRGAISIKGDEFMPLRISAICRKQHSREREEEERLAAGSGPGANM